MAGFVVGIPAGLLDIGTLGDLANIGTLFAFVLVSVGVWIMRRSNPGQHRPFRTPIVPVVSVLGAVICSGMIVALDKNTQLAAGGWMVIGLLVYFTYARSHSKLNKA